MIPLPIIMAAGGGLLGYIKGDRDRIEAERLNKKNAEVARWSPWTGLKPQQPMARVNPWEAALQGAYTGGMMGMNIAEEAPDTKGDDAAMSSDVPAYQPTGANAAMSSAVPAYRPTRGGYSLNFAPALSPWVDVDTSQYPGYVQQNPNSSVSSWMYNDLWRNRPKQ